MQSSLLSFAYHSHPHPQNIRRILSPAIIPNPFFPISALHWAVEFITYNMLLPSALRQLHSSFPHLYSNEL